MDKIDMNDAGEILKCICGNTPNNEGFYTCDNHGERMEPKGNWCKLYVCDRCGRVITSAAVVIGYRKATPKDLIERAYKLEDLAELVHNHILEEYGYEVKNSWDEEQLILSALKEYLKAAEKKWDVLDNIPF